MPNKTLEQAFKSFFHNQQKFSDFCSVDHAHEVEEFTYKSRKVLRTSKNLKQYLRFVDKVILRHLEQNAQVVHSYLKGKSALSAVIAHSKSKVFFTTDIESFFSSIRDQDVRLILARNESRIPISDFKEYLDYLVETLTYEGTLPVGFPTSPQISNAFLFYADNEIQKYCHDNNLIYTRYADDIIISGNDFSCFKGIEKDIEGLLREFGSGSLRLNAEKTRYTHIGNKVKILGLVITPAGIVTIDSKYKRELESLIYFYINDKEKFDDLLHRSLGRGEHSLFGLLHYAKSIDPKYLEKLQRKYGAYTLSVLMEDRWSAE